MDNINSEFQILQNAVAKLRVWVESIYIFYSLSLLTIKIESNNKYHAIM